MASYQITNLLEKVSEIKASKILQYHFDEIVEFSEIATCLLLLSEIFPVN